MNGVRVCKEEDCLGEHLARGWCGKHYQRWKQHGDPKVVKEREYKALEDTFSARTEWQGGCLVWTGGMGSNGYASFRVRGRSTLIHRWVYEQEHGPIPEGQYIDHECRTRNCVNIEHLRLATPKQNQENLAGLRSNNTSGHRGVVWGKITKMWKAQVRSNGKCYVSYHPRYEIHVAAYKARLLRNQHFTHNNLDRGLDNLARTT